MNGYKIVLLKAIFMLYKLPESERVCSGICIFCELKFFRVAISNGKDKLLSTMNLYLRVFKV